MDVSSAGKSRNWLACQERCADQLDWLRDSIVQDSDSGSCGWNKKISCQIVFLIYADAIICDMLKLPRCFVVMV